MWYPVKKALQRFCVQSGIFPAKCENWQEWEAFAENSPRSAVEKLYRVWSLSSDLEEADEQKIECILRRRLQRLESLHLGMSFINAHKNKIFWVRSNWTAKEISSYTLWEKCPFEYPFYVVDEDNNLRGIAVEEGLIFAGALNFATSVDEAEQFFAGNGYRPLTEKDAKRLEKNGAKIRRMMNAVGMAEINGGYLLVDDRTNGWRGQMFSRGISLKRKSVSKGYFLLVKL